MDRKRTGMSLEMVVEEEDYFFHSSSSSSSSDSEDDHDWLDSAFMGSFWVKDPNEERDRERWMASKLGIQCIARRLEKEARHASRARARAEKKEARKRQRLAHLQRIEEEKRREQQQHLLLLQASQMEEPLRPPLMVSDILKARRRRKSEGGSGDQRVGTHSPVYGLMDGGSRIGESGRTLFLKPRSLSTNECSDDSSANDESDGDVAIPVPAPLSHRRVSVDVDDDDESDGSNNSDSGTLAEEGRTLSLDQLESTPEVRPGAAFKLEFKRRWSLNFATTVQAVNPPMLDSLSPTSPASPAVSPSSSATSPLTTPTSPTASSASSLSPAPSPLSSGSQSPSSFRYLSWVREGGSLILNRDKGKRERRGTTLDADKKAATEWRKRTREKAAEGEPAQGLRPDAAFRARSSTVAAVGGPGDLQVPADESKKRSVSVGNKSDTLRVEPSTKPKGQRGDNKTEVMFDEAPPGSSEDTTSTSISISTSTSTTTSTRTPTSGPSAEMTSSTSSFDRIKRQLSGGLDKRRRGMMLPRSRSLTDRNRGSLEGYYANDTVAEASGTENHTQTDSYPSVTIVQLQGGENGSNGGKPGSPVQTRNKTVTKELRTSKSCRNYRAVVGLSGLSTSGNLLTNNSSSSNGSSSGWVGSDEPVVDGAQQRKLEKERRKEEKQREKAERKEREREREREKEQQKELLRRSRRATDVSSPSPAASPRSFMSRLSGVPG